MILFERLGGKDEAKHEPVVKVDGLEGVDALGTPIRHPEAGGDVSEKKVLLRLDVRLFSWRLSDSD